MNTDGRYERVQRFTIRILLISLVIIAWVCLPSIAHAAPLTAKTAEFYAPGAGKYVDDFGKEQPILARKLRTEYDSSILYTFWPSGPELNKGYRLGNEQIVRKHNLNEIQWIAKEHGNQGEPLEGLRELAAVQLCIWSYHTSTYLDSERVPDDELRSRAEYLREQADSHGSEAPLGVLRMVELHVDTVRSTATKVQLEVRLQDAETGKGVPGTSIDLAYDGKSETLKTDDRGRLLVLRQRLDRKVRAEALWEGTYSAGILWISDDGSQPELIQAEPLDVRFRTASIVDPASLKSGPELMYQTIGDFVANNTPIGPQPASVIGLIALSGGWVVLAVRALSPKNKKDSS